MAMPGHEVSNFSVTFTLKLSCLIMFDKELMLLFAIEFFSL